MLAAVLGAGAAVSGGSDVPLLGSLGVLSVLLVVAAAVLAVPQLAAAGIVVLTLAWTISLLINPTALVVAVAFGLFAMSELTFQAVELGPRGTTDEQAERQRAIYLGLVGLVALTVGGLALAAAHRWAGGDLVVEAAGLAAVAAAVLLIVALARDLSGRTGTSSR